MSIEWLLAALPEPRKILRRSEADYYGASHIIAQALGYPEPPRSVASWLHGILYTDNIEYPEVMLTEGNRFTRHLVNNRAQAKWLRSKGYWRAHGVGAPYAYIPPPATERRSGSLLVMPPHGLGGTKEQFREGAFVEHVLSISDYFDSVVACVSAVCVEKGDWIKTFDHYGIAWIRGADSEDANALRRMATIFGSFEYMTTTSLGSHVAYAAHSGCKVSICGNFHEFDFGTYKDVPWYKRRGSKLKALADTSSERYARTNFPTLFVEPWAAVDHRTWARPYLGCDDMRPLDELAGLLGWSISGRMEEAAHNFARASERLAVRAHRRVRRFAGSAA